MIKIEMTIDFMGRNWFMTDIEDTEKKEIRSVTKVLGGREVVHQQREWIDHGYGGWFARWYIKDCDRKVVDEFVRSNGNEIKWKDPRPNDIKEAHPCLSLS